jgi:hypothetical protein
MDVREFEDDRRREQGRQKLDAELPHSQAKYAYLRHLEKEMLNQSHAQLPPNEK